MNVQKPRNSIEFKLTGRYALFSDPITRMGGEKCSYPIPTYEAIKGVVESIYWKPSIIWFVDAVRVMNKIQTESKNIKTLKYTSGGSDLSHYTYLRDVEYRVLAHFEFNENYPDLKMDRNENKHHNMAKRSVVKGGRRDIFLGTRECQGYVEECRFEEGEGAYDNYVEFAFGTQFHGYDYPNETGRPELWKRFWRAVMVNGVIRYPLPSKIEDSMREFVRPMEMKKFIDKKNFSVLSDEDVALA